MSPLNIYLYGFCSATFACAALFFVRFWRQTSDRFFALFAVGFACVALNYAALPALRLDEASRQYVYLLRLVGFLFIVGAIVDKNRRR
jgi:uncharacterized membrane protein YoaK (UPF0700 family)